MAGGDVRLRRATQRAEGYLELGMPQQALDALDQLPAGPNVGMHVLYLRGEALRMLERYQEALGPLESAAEIDPDEICVWLALGWCYKRTARIDLAVEALGRALAVKPADALVHYNLACYLSLAGNKDAALSHLSRALSIDPHYRNLVHDEPDFDAIRSDPTFQALTSIIV
jgi:tetratricopeptide (TPR) repeat protein